jgi:hypothetical protein
MQEELHYARSFGHRREMRVEHPAPSSLELHTAPLRGGAEVSADRQL